LWQAGVRDIAQELDGVGLRVHMGRELCGCPRSLRQAEEELAPASLALPMVSSTPQPLVIGAMRPNSYQWWTLFGLSLGVTSLVSLHPSGVKAKGLAPAQCVACSGGASVSNSNCLVGRDPDGRVNFIQWDGGTASTGLGGWTRVSNNCFAASENSSWRICPE
jgi:hypothetical protein